VVKHAGLGYRTKLSGRRLRTSLGTIIRSLGLAPRLHGLATQSDVNIPTMEGNCMGGLDKINGCKLKKNKTTINPIWGDLLFIT
jgi:hypothetical protein